MELKRRLNSKSIFAGLYIFAFIAYILYGLQPAKATAYEVSATLNIPSINLSSDVTELTLHNHRLDTPDYIVGSFSKNDDTTLLIGHASTIFQGLSKVELGDKIKYDDANYKITMIDMVPKSDVRMNEVLKSSGKKTLKIMTCAGTLYDDGDASHRLIITALVQ